MARYTGIIVNNNSNKVDRIFTYEVPENLQEKICIGSLVKIPFGYGNKKIEGFVIELYDKAENVKNLKYVAGIICDYPVLSDNEIRLIRVMREKYLCTYLECIKCILPNGILKGMSPKKKLFLSTSLKLDRRFNKEPYISIYNYVSENEGKYTVSDMTAQSFSDSSVKTMIKHGYLILGNAARCSDNEILTESDYHRLNNEQEITVNSIVHSDFNRFLIKGVTGSGKTEVYMAIVDYIMKQGKQAIILIPEISLTPQTVERFKNRFGNCMAVFHSRLSDGERLEEWIKVKEGRVTLAIGARSAVFLPFKNLGAIIVDEEHETSYKSDSDPKYNAKEIAMIRSNIEKCKIVLGSATPSVESFNAAEKGSIKLLEMKNRADGALMPAIKVVDMKNEIMAGNRSIFSRDLYDAIANCLKKKEQIILFLNRRGFSTFVSCRKCGYVFKCNNCDISLTYHSEEGCLSCHYCGYKSDIPEACPQCGSRYVKFFGIGTERVEQEIKRIFPGAKTLRMDHDTTKKKNSYEEIYGKFRDGKADILIGTQMIAKGLDFKNVTLVGIISADVSLNFPDYRASEKTFQLITQVSGRAGRGKLPGYVIIQTYNPEHYSIVYSSQNDYERFFHKELSIRKEMCYPPFTKILCINLSSEDENTVVKNIHKISDALKSKYEDKGAVILGPSPCEIKRIKKLYRWQIIIKSEILDDISNDIKEIVYDNLNCAGEEIRISLDINPNSLA